MKRWTDDMDQRLRRDYPTSTDLLALCVRLGVTLKGLRARAKKLGVVRSLERHKFSREDRELIRSQYGKKTTAELAERIGGSVRQIWTLAKRMGLTKRQFVWTEEAIGTVKSLHAASYSDAEIGDVLKCDRKFVGKMRRRLGLPRLCGRAGDDWPARLRERVRAKAAEQCRNAGVANLGELRTLSYKKFAAENGWPSDLRPRAVQILNLLAYRGVPLTRRQICAGIGMRWVGSRKSLVSNDKKGTYLQALVDRGLVVRLDRIAIGNGKGFSVYLYTLGSEALRILQEKANEQ